MTATTAALRGRAAAERLMVDTCTITRSGGAPVYDPATDTYTIPEPTTVYSGKCRLRVVDSMDRDAEAGESLAVVGRRELHLPVTGTGVSDVRLNDVAVITSTTNPNVDGKRFRVSSLGEDQTFQTARRMGVEASDE